jgi:hypothetical protein
MSIASEYPSAGYAWAYIEQQATTIERLRAALAASNAGKRREG